MDYFLLDSKTGELRTAKPLDKEALPDATGLVVLTVRVKSLYKRIYLHLHKCISNVFPYKCNRHENWLTVYLVTMN